MDPRDTDCAELKYENEVFDVNNAEKTSLIDQINLVLQYVEIKQKNNKDPNYFLIYERFMKLKAALENGDDIRKYSIKWFLRNLYDASFCCAYDDPLVMAMDKAISLYKKIEEKEYEDS